jgi:SOS-response transcriptional repressor LexA
MLMDTMGKRIYARRIELELTQRDLGAVVDVSATTITYWERKEVEPKNKHLAALARALDCSPDYLLHGATSGKQGSIASVQSRVPLINWDAVIESGADEERETKDWLYYPKQCGSRTFALIVNNDSMVSPHPNNKSYPSGTTIFVDPEVSITNGSRVIALVGNTAQATFKEYREDGGNSYLIPINPQYPTTTVDDDTLLIGTVIGSFMAE